MKTNNILPKVFLLSLFILLSCKVYSSNISISNVSLTGQVVGSQYTMIQFDISWENSWRTTSAPNNWDAAWIFIKYRVGTGEWQHAWLNNTDHVNPAGCTITTGLLDPASSFNATTNPGLGAFIYRDANGLGTFSKTGLKLRWNYGANGVDDGASVNIKVFAVEMVYVPQGSFYVGSGGNENDAFYKYPTKTNPYQITNETAITVGTSTDNFYYSNVYGSSGDRNGPIPATFPKGYNSFYCMKYEIMQQQYVDFLNSLTQAQADVRKFTGSGFRYSIVGNLVGSYITSTPFVACSYLSWADLAAYLDWSGLRPMTELEFEKACRGTLAPVENEFAWGSTFVIQNNGINNSGLNNETSSTEGANCNCSYGFAGPIRVGIFATSSSTRVSAGATYYGIMEMTGNLYERPVTVGNTTGRAFTGAHGNGLLSISGEANVLLWPVTNGIGTGFRGGDWYVDYSYLRVSGRNGSALSDDSRYAGSGGRGVRTAL